MEKNQRKDNLCNLQAEGEIMGGLGKRVVAEFKSGRICRKPECGIDAELIYRLFFDNTWIEFCPKCREITSGDRNQKV